MPEGGAPLSLNCGGRCGRRLAAGLPHLPGCCGVARGWGCTASWLSPTNLTPEQVLCNCGHAQPVCTAPWAWVCARACAGRAGLCLSSSADLEQCHGCCYCLGCTCVDGPACAQPRSAPLLQTNLSARQLRCCGAWGSAYVAVQEWRSLPPCRRCGKLWPCSDV